MFFLKRRKLKRLKRSLKFYEEGLQYRRDSYFNSQSRMQRLGGSYEYFAAKKEVARKEALLNDSYSQIKILKAKIAKLEEN